MLNQDTKRRIESARDILVGKVPDPKAQVEQITTALIYKFMDDMDKESEELGGEASFFVGDFAKYGWSKLLDSRLGGIERLHLYVEALIKMPQNPHLPQLFRDILKDAFLPYRDPETLSLFLKEINGFSYDHSEKLGDAFEYLLSVLGSQGDAGQFRTPRHIIDFIVAVIDPKKTETILDPACGTAGFLISGYKHILKQNSNEKVGDNLTPDEKTKLMGHFIGYDISPDMVRLSLTNMYLHGFPNPNVFEYDTLTSEERWDETYDVIMANPPFMTPTGGIRPHKHFSVQATRAEVLFVDYILEHLNSSGRAGIIVPEGIVSTSSNGYLSLRKKMIMGNYLYAVISLPAGIFKPYASVKTNILLIDRNLAKSTDRILFIEINNDGFTLSDTRQPVEGSELPLALKVINKFKNGVIFDSEHFHLEEEVKSLFVNKSEINESNTFNLIGKRYKAPHLFSHSSWSMVKLVDECLIVKGQSPTLKTIPGPYSLVVTAKDRKTSDHYDFDGSATCIPLISSTGHGHASIKRLHYQEGKFALANTMCALFPKDNERLNAKYLYYILLSRMEDIFVPLMKGAANVSLHISELDNVSFPLPPFEEQVQIVKVLDNYNEIMDGAKVIIDKYKPEIRIDPSWKLLKLGEVIKVDGKILLNIQSEKNKIHLGGENIEKNTGKLINLETAEVKNIRGPVYKFRTGQILYNKVRPYLNKVALPDFDGR
jgi:type I restriction enzyme M protein